MAVRCRQDRPAYALPGPTGKRMWTGMIRFGVAANWAWKSWPITLYSGPYPRQQGRRGRPAYSSPSGPTSAGQTGVMERYHARAAGCTGSGKWR